MNLFEGFKGVSIIIRNDNSLDIIYRNKCFWGK